MMNEYIGCGRIGSIKKFNYTNAKSETKTGYRFSMRVYNKAFPNGDQWYDVLCYDAMAKMAEFLYVGAQVTVSGRPKAEWYVSHKGEPNEQIKAVISVVARTIDLPPKSVPAAKGANDNAEPELPEPTEEPSLF